MSHPLQGLEVELRSMQAHSLQSEGYLVQLDDRLSSLSSSAGRNLTSLSAEVTRASTWLSDQQLLLRYTWGGGEHSSTNRFPQTTLKLVTKDSCDLSDVFQGNVGAGGRAQREAGRGQLAGGSCQSHLQQ